jgi:hypothetical protein
MTLQDKYEKALIARGFTRIETGKYRVMHKQTASVREPGKMLDTYFFLGASGAVRVNDRKRQDTSRAMSDAWKERLAAEA